MFTVFMGFQYLFTALISQFPRYILYCKTLVYCYQEINILEHMVLDQLGVKLFCHPFHGLLQLPISFLKYHDAPPSCILKYHDAK